MGIQIRCGDKYCVKKPGFFGKLGNAVGNTFGAVGNIAAGLGTGIASMFGSGQGGNAEGTQEHHLEHVNGEIRSENVNKIIFKDKADNCFMFEEEVIDCPEDVTKISTIPIQA